MFWSYIWCGVSFREDILTGKTKGFESLLYNSDFYGFIGRHFCFECYFFSFVFLRFVWMEWAVLLFPGYAPSFITSCDADECLRKTEWKSNVFQKNEKKKKKRILHLHIRSRWNIKLTDSNEKHSEILKWHEFTTLLILHHSCCWCRN